VQSITPITTDDFKAKSNIVIAKVEIDSDGAGTYIVLPDIKDISITTNIQNVVSRFCSYSFFITCLNTDDRYSPFNGSSPYYRKLKRGRKLKVYMGIKKSGIEYFWQWQLWIIDNIKESEKAGESICTITGRNLMGLLLDYKLYYPNTFWGNTIYLNTKDGKYTYQLPNTPTMGNWDIRGAYQIGTKSVHSEDGLPYSLWFSLDGTKMYILGVNTDTIYQYTLSTGWDVVTAIYEGVYKSVNAQDTTPQGTAFSPDGDKLYVVGWTNKKIFQYELGVSWDISSAVYSSKFALVSGETSNPRDVYFSSDGTKMYLVSSPEDYVYQYTLTTPWDVSTASYASKSLNVGAQESTPSSIFFNNDGSKMYIIGSQDKVFQYTLGTPWDLSTAVYDSVYKSLITEGTSIIGLFFKSDGSKMYVLDTYQDVVFEYTLDDDTIDVASGVYQVSVDDIDPRDGTDEEDFSIVTEGSDFVYNKWENTITFGTGGIMT